jgi:hypothetical protein
MSYKSEYSSTKEWNCVDTNIRLTRPKGHKFIAMLKRNNIKTVIRYYASTRRSKTVTKAEVKMLNNEGFYFLPVYQDNARRTRDFGYNKGKIAGRNALDFADYVGQPIGTSILFAVDTDFTRSQILRYVVPYFKGVKEVINGKYRIGAYGGGSVMRILLDEDLIEIPWLSMSRGFLGTRTFFEDEDWAMRQIPPPKMYQGFHYDKNHMKWSPKKIGAFNLNHDNLPDITKSEQTRISTIDKLLDWVEEVLENEA